MNVDENAQKCPKGNRDKPLGTKSEEIVELAEITNKKYRSRSLVFTSFDEEEPNHNMNNELIEDNQIKYICYGAEVCPKTNKKHWQGYVYFFEKASYTKAKKLLKIKKGWFQYAKATIEDNRTYCSKEGKFKEYGNIPKQGQRVDLDDLKDSIKAGIKTVDEITMENPMMYHQYGRTLSRIEAICLRKKFRTEMTKGFWYHGKTGVGKSHKAFKGFNPDTHYVGNIAQISRGFWTGYTGQTTVIINEFRGQIGFGELLDLVDKWPKTVDIKCGEPVPFLAEKFIITAPLPPQQTYSGMMDKEGNIDQLLRRFEIVELRI